MAASLARSTAPMPYAAGLLLMLLVACGGEAGPAIPVGEPISWALPLAGEALPTPRALAIDRDGNLAILDTAGRVVICKPDGTPLREWSMPATSVGNPEGLLWLADGRLAVADTHYFQVVIFEADGTLSHRWGTSGEGPGEFGYPIALAQDDAGDLYVSEYGGNDRVQVFRPDGTYLRTMGGFGTGPGEFQRPTGLAWKGGTLYVADAVNHRVLAFDARSGEYLRVVGDASLALDLPYDLKLGPEGDLWVVCYGAGRVTRLATDGTVRGRYGQTGTGHGDLRTPWGLAVSPTNVWVADTGNRRVLQLSRNP